MKRHLLAYFLIFVLSVVSSSIIMDYSDDQNDRLQVRLENERIDALEKVCRQNVADRRVLIRQARVDVRGNEAIANDPTTSSRARDIRREQATVEREAIEDLKKRLNKSDGGEVDCNIR